MNNTKILSCFLRETGGVAAFQKNIGQYINHNKFQLDFVTIRGDVSKFSFFSDRGSKIYNMSCSFEDDKDTFISEFNAILKNGYDVVHLHTNFWQSLACEEIAEAEHIPIVIIHAHNSSVSAIKGTSLEFSVDRHNKLKNQIDIHHATHFLACSDLAADFLFGENIPKEKITILNYGINTEKFKYNQIIRTKIRHEFNLDDKFVVGHAGRFEKQKNHTFIIKLFNQLKIDNAVLLLAGNGKHQDEIKSLTEKLGIAEKIIFLGQRDDMYDFYNAMDLFILPSLYEGFGIVAIEAECNGLKTLLSDQVPKTAAITDNAEHLPLDLDTWCEKIHAIYKNGYERKDSSEIVRKAGFDMADNIKILEKIYAGEYK